MRDDPELAMRARDAGMALTGMVAEVTDNPARIAVLFPAVARAVARGPGDPADPDGLLVPHLEDRARVTLLVAAAGVAADPAALAADLYRYGDADEKRAVLRALGTLPLRWPATVRWLVEDALRSNDPRLIAAAMGPFACRHLTQPAWRQGVLKCLFTGVPLVAVAGWADRADAELARMAAGYAAEREAAGRPVPSDVRRVMTHQAEKGQS